MNSSGDVVAMGVDVRQIPGMPGWLARADGWVMAPCGRWTRGSSNSRHKPYLRVWVYDHKGGRKGILVHRLILLAFVGECPPGMQVRHKDDDKNNNAIENLSYGTCQQNRHDCYYNGKAKTPGAKLTWDDVVQIREMAANGVRQARMVERFAISSAHVSNIIAGKTWKYPLGR